MIHFDAPIAFPIFFGFFEILLLFGAVDMWLTRRVIDVNRAELAYSKAIFGPGKQKILPADEIKSIKPNRGMQSGNKLYYQIEVRAGDDKKHTIANQIGGLQLTKSLIKEIEDNLDR
jgi:hypothetical protein